MYDKTTMTNQLIDECVLFAEIYTKDNNMVKGIYMSKCLSIHLLLNPQMVPFCNSKDKGLGVRGALCCMGRMQK